MSRLSQPRPDLSAFHEANQQDIPWEERSKLIERVFPATKHLDWGKEFANDSLLYGMIVKDILKLDKYPGTGPRRKLEYEDDHDRYKQLLDNEYSEYVFHEAVQILAADQSIKSISEKVDLSYQRVYGLFKGKITPERYDMEQIAAVFGKHPAYFLEYRHSYIAGSILGMLWRNPEAGVSLYNKLTGRT